MVVVPSFRNPVMDQKALEKRLAGLNLAGIRYFKTLDSTNATAARWASRGAADFSIVIADQQEKGVGRAGRRWFTFPGAALAFSLILRPTLQEQNQPGFMRSRYTGLGAVAVNQAMRNHYGLDAKIKWPNDVLVNQRKICGVLVEAQWMGDQLSSLVLGIGINIAPNAVPRDHVLNFPATSLDLEVGSPQDRLEVLYHVLLEIRRWRIELIHERFLRTWEAGLAYLGEKVRLTTVQGEGRADTILVEGTVAGLSPDGALRILTGKGEKLRFQSGEISRSDFRLALPAETDFHLDEVVHLRPVDSSVK